MFDFSLFFTLFLVIGFISCVASLCLIIELEHRHYSNKGEKLFVKFIWSFYLFGVISFWSIGSTWPEDTYRLKDYPVQEMKSGRKFIEVFHNEGKHDVIYLDTKADLVTHHRYNNYLCFYSDFNMYKDKN